MEADLSGRCTSLYSTPRCAKSPGNNSAQYDVNTETKMKGTVEEVKLPLKGSEKEVAHLLVKTGDTVDEYLCPKSFPDDMGVSFRKGDEIALTGSKVKQGEADLILAREVVKGTSSSATRKAIPAGVGTADCGL